MKALSILIFSLNILYMSLLFILNLFTVCFSGRSHGTISFYWESLLYNFGHGRAWVWSHPTLHLNSRVICLVAFCWNTRFISEPLFLHLGGRWGSNVLANNRHSKDNSHSRTFQSLLLSVISFLGIRLISLYWLFISEQNFYWKTKLRK